MLLILKPGPHVGGGGEEEIEGAIYLEVHGAVVAAQSVPVSGDLADLEFFGVDALQKAERELFDNAPAGDGYADGANRGPLGLGGGLEIEGEAGDGVGRRRDRDRGAQAVLQGVTAADSFPGCGARSGGAERIAAAGGDLCCGAHLGLSGSEIPSSWPHISVRFQRRA
ncbi:MAG TPA: hypothetical protein VFA04_23875 [Bryobacteraceae bacterium]|nr:hypothetical protein [Bryobacteraceae bacterium]